MEFGIGKREDISSILELYKQLYENNISFDNFHTEEVNKAWDSIENCNIKYFLAKDDNKTVASCYICIIPNLAFNGRSIGFIEHVIVDKNYRRKSIGKKIMEMAIEYAKNNNCYKVVLQSGKKRNEAHKLYEKLGFNRESKIAYELRFKD
jgi:ribosomal protein S18 acetylase RimI-like enzyme